MINDVEIDLTEHRDFGEHFQAITLVRRNGRTFSNMGSIIEQQVRRQIYGRFPWAIKPVFEQKVYKYDGLVALGNESQRKAVIEVSNWGTRNNTTCDCCGKKYTKIPWIKDWGICKECNEEITSIRTKEIPWRM